MQVFNDLHVVGGNHHASVTERLHFSPGKSRQADRGCAGPSRRDQSLDYVGRVSTGADGERDIFRADKIDQLFREDIFVVGVIGPSRHDRNVICQSDYAKSFSGTVRSSFSQIAGEVRGEGGTAPVAKQEDRTPAFKGCHQHADNTFDVCMWKLSNRVGQSFKIGSAIGDRIQWTRTF